MEQRAVVRFFTLKDFSPKDIQAELASAYMDDVLFSRTFYKWHKRLERGRT
jgi:hypothetical protein